jgi:hypothetical protein
MAFTCFLGLRILNPNEINTSKAKTMLDPSPIQDARL